MKYHKDDYTIRVSIEAGKKYISYTPDRKLLVGVRYGEIWPLTGGYRVYYIFSSRKVSHD